MSDHAFEEPADPVFSDPVFNDLVARFDETPERPTWPTAEDLQLPPRPPAVAAPPTRAGAPDAELDPPTETDLGVLDAGDPTGPDQESDQESDDEGHYVPPAPPPAPPLRPATRAALASLAIGVALLVGPALSGRESPVVMDALAVLFVLGGMGTLVARMRETRSDGEHGDDWDDGAVV